MVLHFDRFNPPCDQGDKLRFQRRPPFTPLRKEFTPQFGEFRLSQSRNGPSAHATKDCDSQSQLLSMKRRTSPSPPDLSEVFDPLRLTESMRRNKIHGNCFRGKCNHSLRMPALNMNSSQQQSPAFYAAQLQAVCRLSSGEVSALRVAPELQEVYESNKARKVEKYFADWNTSTQD